jgi:methylase of polypeptide subunit release factors
LRSAVRFSSLGDLLLVHSAFPTQASDAVFFGPDTYRFARAIAGAVRQDDFPAPETIVDIGTGSGAGALVAGRLLPGARLILTDVNRAALRFAEVNAALNGFASVEIRQSDVLAEVPERPGLILSNPPYLVDAAERVYRHGGGQWGFDLSLRIADEALARLAPGGRLILYTGTPVVDGIDVFLQALRPVLERRRVTYSYEEIDPDVFAEELLRPPYDKADRIAAVLLIADAPHRGN